MLVSSFCVVMAENEYPDAKLVFSGFTMKYGLNGKIQGLVDVSLENIDATGVYFNMKYDSKYLVPSNYATNNATISFSEFFEQNTDVFPIVTDEYGDVKNSLNTLFSDITQPASSGDEGNIEFDLLPSADAENSEYIGEKNPYPTSSDDGYIVKCIKANERKVSLMTLSFEITDPMAVSKMSAEDLSKILYVDGDVEIMYVDQDGIEQFTSIISSSWSASRVLIEVEPAVEESTVSAYSIYGDGTEADLIAYLNRKMNTVIQKYSDGEQYLDKIVWDSTADGFSIDQIYDPHGGVTYTVTQTYMDKTVTVKVTVTKVIITGFDYINRIKTYIDPDRPSEWADLAMPEVITPILYGTDDLYVPPTDKPLQNDWSPNEVTESLKTSPAPLSETYTHDVPITLFGDSNPLWLTIPDGFNWQVSVIRNVLETSNKPDEDSISASVARTTGILTIEVGSLDGNPIPDDTEFNIYLPNGMVIKSTDDKFVTVTISDGKAVITVDALQSGADTAFTDAEREMIQALINLAEPGFKLTAVTDGIESEQTPFTFNARENYYLDDDVKDGYIEKDYSEGRKTMFAVSPSQKLSDISTYIEFPDKSTIPVAYDGQTGLQPSELSAAKVVRWTILDDSTATELPSTPSTTVTLVGLLEAYTYTNFGLVTNPDNIALRIKVTTADSSAVSPPTADMEQIKITTSVNGTDVQLTDGMTFEYDKQTTGYAPSTVQDQEYTIENIGTTQIDGLTVRIAAVTGDANGSDAFVLSDALTVTELTVGDKTTFKIRTKCGLAAGTYTARVIVGSNMNTELDGFDITFTVTDNEVYRVNVDDSDAKNNGVGYGYLRTSDGSKVCSNTYEVGETVNVYAVLTDTAYKFDEWTSNQAVTIADANKLIASFVMIAEEVTVVPNFMETPELYRRLVGLEDYNSDDSQNPLREDKSPYPVTTFAEKTYNYRVIVDGDKDKNYVKFTLKDRYIDDLTVTVTANGTPCTTTVKNKTEFTSDIFDLKEGTNTVTIQTEYTDPDDGTKYTQTYTLTILRKKAVDVKLQFGNSPYGLIESDSSFTDSQKKDAEAYFHTNHTYGQTYVPEGAANTYKTMYYTDAWTSSNYDEDKYALFVYNDSAFVDPGFKELKDSDGNTVDPTTVTRKIEFDIMPSTTDVLDDLQNTSSHTETIASGGETCVIDLTSYRIRPGAYSIEYSFKDVDGSERTFSRSLVVLNRKGDVTLDRTVTADDYEMLYERIGNGYYTEILQSTDEWAAIYAYRIGDVTEDRNVNSIDADAVRNTLPLTEYYEQLPTSLTQTMPTYDSTTAVWTPQATLPPNKATLTLDYLGNGSSPNATAQTPGLTADDVNAINSRDVVWVGIGIKNPQNLEYFMQGIYSMDFAIDYDPTIFAPCNNYGDADTGSGINPSIAETITDYNLDSYLATGGTSDVQYWSNASLYEQSLLTAADLDSSGTYKTEFVTIISNDGTDLRMNNIPSTTDTIYLLRVPFKLIAYPDSSYTGKAITLHLSEQTFVMGSGTTGTEASASWEGTFDKTTDVNNLKNHFDDVEIVDIFGTDGKFNIMGKVTAWNTTQPVRVDIYKADDTTGIPFYTFFSSDVDEFGNPKYGALTQTTKKGECEWEYKLPVSNRFDYKMVVTKLSHLDYPEISVEKTGVKDDKYEITDTIDLIVGDINGDGIIKLPDRAELMRFFNRQKPWALNKSRFEAADLNGDDAVNLFDLNLLSRNYEKAYSIPTPTPSAGTGSVDGGGGTS
jgi:hypothetical protein